MRHQPDVRGCELVVGAGEGPAVGAGLVVDVDGEDGVGELGAGGDDGAVQGVEDCSYAL